MPPKTTRKGTAKTLEVVARSKSLNGASIIKMMDAEVPRMRISTKDLNKDALEAVYKKQLAHDPAGMPASVKDLKTTLKGFINSYNDKVENVLKFEKRYQIELPADIESWSEWGLAALNELGGKALLNKGGYKFLGPGTKIAKRIVDGDEPENELDKLAKQHDIAYLRIGAGMKGKSKTELDKEIDKADQRFITDAQKLGEEQKGKDDALSADALTSAKIMTLKKGQLFDPISIIQGKQLSKEELADIDEQIQDIEEEKKGGSVVMGSPKMEGLRKAIAQAVSDSDEDGDVALPLQQAGRSSKQAKQPEEVKVPENVKGTLAKVMRKRAKQVAEKELSNLYRREAIKVAGMKGLEGELDKPEEDMTEEELALHKKYAKFHAEQKATQQAKLDSMNIRYTDKVITGERSMRADLTQLGGDYVKLTPDEKARNIAFYSSLNFVKEGSGNGNQQIIPYSYNGWMPNNRLLDSNNNQTTLRYGGRVNFGDQYVAPRLTPSRSTLNKFGVVMIPSNQHNQQWMPAVPFSSRSYQTETIGKPIQFSHRETQPTMYAATYSKNTRLFNSNVVNGDPWGKSGVRV